MRPERVGAVAGASVMGSAIVSVALELRHHRTLSAVTLVVAAALWVGLAAVLALRARRDPGAVRAGLTTPAALTAVAGTAVIGSRLVLGADLRPAGVALAGATVLWAVLLAGVERGLGRGVPGSAFLVAVATASLASLSAQLAAADDQPWLLLPALAALVLALLLYLDVLRRFAVGQLLEGHGDHWVAGGALAICALACANLAKGATALEATGVHALRVATTVLWVAAMLWLPVLLVAEVVRPRLRYDARRWATVFPVGMYAAASSATGQLLAQDAITAFARVWTWVAVAVWAVVLAGLLRRAPT